MSHHDERHPDDPPVVVRDRRRIDPDTGSVRPEAPIAAPGSVPGAAPGDAAATAPADGELAALQATLDERTADLQRVTAEYANYRKRVDRDRESVVTYAKAQVVADLLGVLDDVDRAEAHGDLTGVLKSVAEKVQYAVRQAGLEAYGHEGEEFDPSAHEAVQHDTSPDVSGPTVTAVLRRGYRFGDRVLRPAMVAVTDHDPAAPATDAGAAGTAGAAATNGSNGDGGPAASADASDPASAPGQG